LLDRFDLTVEVPAVSAADLLAPRRTPETSAVVAQRVTAARAVQAARYAALGRPDVLTNAVAPAGLVELVATPDSAGMKLLREASDIFRLSARGYHRVLKVARTLADLDGRETIGRIHIGEALSYRAGHERLQDAA
jgi:magnesium chelatase family protein